MKKAQIRILETIAVLFIIFIIIIIGLIIQLKFQQRIDRAKNIEQFELESMKISQQITTLPELQCSKNNIVKDNCIDQLKAEAFTKANKQKYYPVFGYSQVTLKQLYPEKNELIIYENQKDYKKQISNRMPILIYNPLKETYSYGVLIIDVYR